MINFLLLVIDDQWVLIIYYTVIPKNDKQFDNSGNAKILFRKQHESDFETGKVLERSLLQQTYQNLIVYNLP